MSNILVDLTTAQAKVSQATQTRTEAISQRDTLIAAARDAGITWAQIRHATGLTPRSIALALKRHQNHTDVPEQTYDV